MNREDFLLILCLLNLFASIMLYVRTSAQSKLITMQTKLNNIQSQVNKQVTVLLNKLMGKNNDTPA